MLNSATYSGGRIAFKLLKESADKAPNSAGKVFTIAEFKLLLTLVWTSSMIEQGYSLTFYRDNRDASGCLHPIRESEYREPVLADCCEQLQPSEEC